MISQLLRALASRRYSTSGVTPPSDSSLGSLVGPFGPSKFCWEARGAPRQQFQQEILSKIVDCLNDYFGSLPGNDHFTLSLYMIGRSADTAAPTILFVSRNRQSRKDARRAMKESGILSRYSDFETAYVSKDPGTDNLVPLASETGPDAKLQAVSDPVEVFYDTSRPISSIGMPIYIQHAASLRPATANTVQIGDRIFLQTVQHAFCHNLSEKNTAVANVGGEIEIDSDSESEIDKDDDALFYKTHDHNPDLSLCSSFSECGYSSPLSSVSSTCTLFEATAWQENATSSILLKAAANLAPIQPTEQKFAWKNIIPPSADLMSPLGRLVKESTENDWALVEIENSELEGILRLLLKQGISRAIAYDKIALCPEYDTKVYTHTASGGKLSGVLSSTPSYTRLPNSMSFQEVYVVRFEGSLANGDCGSVIIDASTACTYGHLVAGCETTGFAYILAAHQTAKDFGNLKKHMENLDSHANQSAHQLSGLFLESQHKQKENDHSKLQPNDPRLTTTKSITQEQRLFKGYSRTNNLLHVPLILKTWLREFSGSSKPIENRPWVKEFKREHQSSAYKFEGGIIQQFLRSHDGEKLPLNVEMIVRFMRGAESWNLHDQGKRGTAWLDDRTFTHSAPGGDSVASVPSVGLDSNSNADLKLFEACSTRPVPTSPGSGAAAASKNISLRYSKSEYDIIRGATKVQISPQSLSVPKNAYCPDTRSARFYPAPLTAHQLFLLLREKRFGHSDLLDADRRLIYIADPDTYDILALVETVTEHQRQSLRHAINSYLAFNTSISVAIKETPLGATNPVFCLEFHIPYFALRHSRLPALNMKSKTRAHRYWTKIDFLGKCSEESKEYAPSIYQAQISLTICGTSDSRWVGYCFEDRYFDSDEELKVNEALGNENFDRIATADLGLNSVIWDPRQYYLTVLQIRTRQIQNEWQVLVEYVQEGVDELLQDGFYPNEDGMPPELDHSQKLTSIVSTIRLLGNLINTITIMNEAWSRFTSETGDIAFFFDEDPKPQITHIYHQLCDDFRRSEELEKRLSFLLSRCKLSLEIKLLPQRSDLDTLTRMAIYFVFPLLLTTSLFSMEFLFVYFDRNFFSFMVVLTLCFVTTQTISIGIGNVSKRKSWWNKLSPAIKMDSLSRSSTTINSGGARVLRRRAGNHTV